MSYILDALRKAERDRPRGMVRVPAPPSAPASGAARYWRWALGGAIAVNAAILIWMTWPGADTRRDQRPATAASPGPIVTAPAPAGSAGAPARIADAPGSMVAKERVAEPPAPPATEPAAAAGVPAAPARPAAPPGLRASEPPEARPTPAGPPAPVAPPAARRTSPVTRPATPTVAPSAPRPAVTKAVPAERPAASSAATPAAPGQAAVPGPRASVPAPAATHREPEPAATDAQLQRLRLQFVAYSDVAAERFVFIDNQKLVEGQSVEAGVVVERIDPASVVLKHPGGRFVLRADPRAAR